MFALKQRQSGTSTAASKGQRKREREAMRSRMQSASSRDIGPMPQVADVVRRNSTAASFRLFAETYFKPTFCKPWCNDHLKAIQKIEAAVLRGGLFSFALPRGAGKTVLTTTAAVWAMLHGHRHFVVLIGATEAAAEQLLTNIKNALRTNDVLAADFPEVCGPIRALENDARRCNGQLSDGQKTNIGWTSKRLILPTIAQSKVSGSIATIAGLTGRIRGQNHALPDGRIIRPDLVIPDDPQTSESAWSDSQTQHRAELLNGDVLGLAGPGHRISVIMPCTVIRKGDLADRFLDRAVNPEWQGERAAMVYSFPTNVKRWEELILRYWVMLRRRHSQLSIMSQGKGDGRGALLGIRVIAYKIAQSRDCRSLRRQRHSEFARISIVGILSFLWRFHVRIHFCSRIVQTQRRRQRACLLVRWQRACLW
jgi:hypothetical protein